MSRLIRGAETRTTSGSTLVNTVDRLRWRLSRAWFGCPLCRRRFGDHTECSQAVDQALEAALDVANRLDRIEVTVLPAEDFLDDMPPLVRVTGVLDGTPFSTTMLAATWSDEHPHGGPRLRLLERLTAEAEIERRFIGVLDGWRPTGILTGGNWDGDVAAFRRSEIDAPSRPPLTVDEVPDTAANGPPG